ncbi:MAG: hypothetical protein AAFP85_15410, partial [Pseudomonadota bacterium]
PFRCEQCTHGKNHRHNGLLQVPGGGPAVLGLVIVSVVLAMGALLASEWLARRAARRVAA